MNTCRFLKKCAGVSKGARLPGHEVAGEVHVKQIYEIAKIKKKEPYHLRNGLREVCRMIISTAKSMGIRVIDTRGIDGN